ncbi:MAG: DegV family protein [Rhodocyclaceae bacterium]
MSSIGLVVDATCDLSFDFIGEHGVMPISVRAGQHTLVDTRDDVPSFSDMLRTAHECGVDVLRAVMSAASGTQVGPGCISVGFAAEDHRYAT